MMSTAPTFTVLFDSTGDLFNNEFIDAEGRVIYKLATLHTQPNVTQLERTKERLALHPSEPWRAVMQFGNGGELGHLYLGERPATPMATYLKRKSGLPGRSRFFVAVDGNEYQWRPGSRRIECYDKNDRLIALYEWLLDGPSHARLEIKIGGWHILSEIMTTLLLNRYAIRHEV
ncbi:hypothetical protein RSOLAG1IB_05687 [Rhizoctonia solani AG-1 IB]|uniref:DUF6593 domain-containing protein n=1 Tax=Thanatephorus cucumeris (strain AG1-IB / isolate 7/3/14) TaxID=1108050 RepID=A0A0B7G606_THACB|nr:hypothetical protein RSOLAG1IB_05687 [Rhizoctonia solani AG-1 IB]